MKIKSPSLKWSFVAVGVLAPTALVIACGETESNTPLVVVDTSITQSVNAYLKELESLKAAPTATHANLTWTGAPALPSGLLASYDPPTYSTKTYDSERSALDAPNADWQSALPDKIVSEISARNLWVRLVTKSSAATSRAVKLTTTSEIAKVKVDLARLANYEALTSASFKVALTGDRESGAAPAILTELLSAWVELLKYGRLAFSINSGAWVTRDQMVKQINDDNEVATLKAVSTLKWRISPLDEALALNTDASERAVDITSFKPYIYIILTGKEIAEWDALKALIESELVVEPGTLHDRIIYKRALYTNNTWQGTVIGRDFPSSLYSTTTQKALIKSIAIKSSVSGDWAESDAASAALPSSTPLATSERLLDIRFTFYENNANLRGVTLYLTNSSKLITNVVVNANALWLSAGLSSRSFTLRGPLTSPRLEGGIPENLKAYLSASYQVSNQADTPTLSETEFLDYVKANASALTSAMIASFRVYVFAPMKNVAFDEINGPLTYQSS